MTDNFIWDCISVVARFGVAICIVFNLFKFYEHFNLFERIGMGVAGGCAIMTTFYTFFDPENNPYQPWSNAMFALGVFIYFIARISRKIKHPETMAGWWNA
jgi:ABC-type Fe3+-siderophore transport system permease subunit